MADYDALDHGVSWKWKRTYTLIEHGAAPVAVANAAIKALTATLRHEGGLPHLEGFARIAEDVAAGRESGGDAIARVKRLERMAGAASHTRDAVQVVKRLVVEIAQGDLPSSPYCLEIAERFCRELIEQRCFSRARPRLMGETWPSYAEYEWWQARVDDALHQDIQKVAQRLIVDPSGKAVIAPRHPRPRPIPTSVLLDMPLDE